MWKSKLLDKPSSSLPVANINPVRSLIPFLSSTLSPRFPISNQLPFDEVESVEFARQGGGAVSSRTFDLVVRMKNEAEHQFRC